MLDFETSNEVAKSVQNYFSEIFLFNLYVTSEGAVFHNVLFQGGYVHITSLISSIIIIKVGRSTYLWIL